MQPKLPKHQAPESDLPDPNTDFLEALQTLLRLFPVVMLLSSGVRLGEMVCVCV